MKDGNLMTDIIREAADASVKFGPFASTHEALGVLMEEVSELIEAIRANDMAQIQKEAVQVSAVAFRLANSCVSRRFSKRSGAEPTPRDP